MMLYGAVLDADLTPAAEELAMVVLEGAVVKNDILAVLSYADATHVVVDLAALYRNIIGGVDIDATVAASVEL